LKINIFITFGIYIWNQNHFVQINALENPQKTKSWASRYDMSIPFMRWDLVFVGVNFTGPRTIHLCLKVFVLVVFIVRVSLVILTKHKEEKEGYKTNNTFPNSNFCVHFILKV
jgi:hypothetical protein